jgi:plasmid stabilization system protein ParE
VSGFRIEPGVARQLDEIYDYTRDKWGPVQAERYSRGLFESFQAIANQALASRSIPVHFGVDGQYCRYEQHFIYWKRRSDGLIAIFAVLHVRMSQQSRLRLEQEP